jgi:hypothetical protein
MNHITATGIGPSSIVMGSDKQAWLRLPDGVTTLDATKRGWFVVICAFSMEPLVLCQQLTYCGGPKSGIYWEPVQLSSLPEADLP